MPAAPFTKAIGMEFSAEARGPDLALQTLCGCWWTDGKVTLFQAEVQAGVCDMSGGEALLDNMLNPRYGKKRKNAASGGPGLRFSLVTVTVSVTGL